ncbi:MAG: preprotein translocase subunit SecE [Leptospirales bacterium]|nr:preprotein translocase subunit SecE [Leptospirales bacterium]
MFMVKFLKESREELRKVVWPSKEEVVNSTLVVLSAVILISLFLFGIDRLFSVLFDTLVRLGSR